MSGRAWVLACAALACTPARAVDAPPTLGTPLLLAVPAAGDTLRYTMSWGAAAFAAGYRANVRAQETGWTNLPIDFITSATQINFLAIHMQPWDTVHFRAWVHATRGAEISRDSAWVTWRVVRALGAPGPIIIDSSQIVAALDIRPQTTVLTVGQTLQFCAFYRDLAGGRHRVTNSEIAACDLAWSRYLQEVST